VSDQSPYGYSYEIFYGDNTKHLRTKCHFREFPHNSRELGVEPVFTLRDWDTDGCISLRRVYLEVSDPTEYEFAQKVFGSWDVWLRVREAHWFQDTYLKMKRELEAKVTSMGYREIEAKADKHVSAAKYLADKGWTKKAGTKGRPTKQSIREAAHDIAREDRQIDEDYKRLIN